MQIPYLARHCRVLTFDGRGLGRSGRPGGVAAYVEDEFAGDALAVMDATNTDRAMLVGLSCAALWGTILAADYIAPAVGLAPGHSERQVYAFDEEYDTEQGWAKYNSHFWSRRYREFLEFFFASGGLAEATGGRLVTLEGAATSRRRVIRSGSTCCCATSSSWRRRRGAGCAAGRAASARCTSPRRSGWGTLSGTPRSPRSCAGSIPTCRSTGSPSTR
jgi:pimeloyl-ACP methyl ester carboxylesterase